jgi:hypothetical protein
LVILLQAVMLSIIFSFIILGSRQGTSFLPCRDYIYFVGEFKPVWRPAAGRSGPWPGPRVLSGEPAGPGREPPYPPE